MKEMLSENIVMGDIWYGWYRYWILALLLLLMHVTVWGFHLFISSKGTLKIPERGFSAMELRLLQICYTVATFSCLHSDALLICKQIHSIMRKLVWIVRFFFLNCFTVSQCIAVVNDGHGHFKCKQTSEKSPLLHLCFFDMKICILM